MPVTQPNTHGHYGHDQEVQQTTHIATQGRRAGTRLEHRPCSLAPHTDERPRCRGLPVFPLPGARFAVCDLRFGARLKAVTAGRHTWGCGSASCKHRPAPRCAGKQKCRIKCARPDVWESKHRPSFTRPRPITRAPATQSLFVTPPPSHSLNIKHHTASVFDLMSNKRRPGGGHILAFVFLSTAAARGGQTGADHFFFKTPPCASYSSSDR
jgi:hypothetical protein